LLCTIFWKKITSGYAAVEASSQSIPLVVVVAAAAAAAAVQLMASLVCQVAMFVARSGLEADYAQPWSTSVAETVLEIRLDFVYPGDLRTFVDPTETLC